MVVIAIYLVLNTRIKLCADTPFSILLPLRVLSIELDRQRTRTFIKMSDRRVSINDIRLPPDVIKGYSVEGLKELSNQDEGSFYEFFQGLDLEDVSSRAIE